MRKPTVPEVLPLVKALYARHGTGCCWHIVLDDCNVDNGCVERCAARAQQSDHIDCQALIEPLLAMSKTQRRKLHYAP
jgi:hypothetical protein